MTDEAKHPSDEECCKLVDYLEKITKDYLENKNWDIRYYTAILLGYASAIIFLDFPSLDLAKKHINKTLEASLKKFLQKKKDNKGE